MKAYPDELLKTSLILEEAVPVLENQNPQNSEFVEAVKILKTKIYQPPFWIRVGLFVATWFGGAFTMFWIGLFLFGVLDSIFSNEISAMLISISASIAAFFIARHFIRFKNHYCSGIDDALGIACLLSLGFSAFMVREILNLPELQWYSLLISSIVTGWFSAYFLDRFMAFLAICLLLFGLYKFVLITPLGMMILPAIYFLTGSILWLINRKWQKQNNLFYESLVDFVEVCCLVLIALSSQFVLVEFAFQQLMNATGPLPYGHIFIFLSLFIPVLMVIIGWREKNRAMLWVGFLGSSFGFYSIASQHLYWPHEMLLLLIGSLFLGLGYMLYNKLKSKKLPGFDMDAGAKQHFLQDVVSQVIQTTVATERPESPPHPTFGEGDFGGAGSSGTF